MLNIRTVFDVFAILTLKMHPSYITIHRVQHIWLYSHIVLLHYYIHDQPYSLL